MLQAAALDYHLPPDLIATRPAEPRDAARLLVVSRTDESLVEHRRFRDLADYLRPDDLLLLNRTTVLPARFKGRRADTGGKVEGLFLGQAAGGRWRVMLKSNSRLRPDHQVVLAERSGRDSTYALDLIERTEDHWLVELRDTELDSAPQTSPGAVLREIGATPIPPYILAARRDHQTQIDDQADRSWYQTVYADPHAAASVAAPTAGLHFTPELLARLDSTPVRQASVFLDVGHGTFKPIETETVEAHPIHAEHIHIPPQTIEALEGGSGTFPEGEANLGGAGGGGRGRGRRICVGTTSVRAVESLPSPITPDIRREGFSTDTDLYVLPGFRFRHTDALITNFHLPKSTLLALVGAFLPGGVGRLLDLYRIAIDHEYRFYSYGDAMLILP